MIPKIIHYCWFGGNPLPESAKKYIDSWKTFFPGYEIKEWNESNYDVHKNRFINEAYKAHKYAFVSDFARFDILYQYGGLYFDTDVEVIKSFDDILAKGSYMGCEIDGGKTGQIYVNPGLGMAIEPHHPLLAELVNLYNSLSFLNQDGTMNMKTVVEYTTELLGKRGLQNIKGIQSVDNINIYPMEYFNPKDSRTGVVNRTENTHSIHWYAMTWMSPWQKRKQKVLIPLRRIFGPQCFALLKKILRIRKK